MKVQASVKKRCENCKVITRKGVAKPLVLTEIPMMGRGVQGKVVIETSGGDPIATLKRVVGPTQPASANNTPEPDGDKGKSNGAATPKATKPAPATTPTRLKTELKMAPPKPIPTATQAKATQNGTQTAAKPEKATVLEKAVVSGKAVMQEKRRM